MVNDRVNCMRYVFTSKRLHTLYKLTTFFVADLSFFQKFVLPIETGRGAM